MRLQLISLDLIVALPIVSGAVLLLFLGFGSAQGYLLQMTRSEGGTLTLYYDSQYAVTLLESRNESYSEAAALLQNYSANEGINATMYGLGQAAVCSGPRFCRTVTISSGSYLLVIEK